MIIKNNINISNQHHRIIIKNNINNINQYHSLPQPLDPELSEAHQAYQNLAVVENMACAGKNYEWLDVRNKVAQMRHSLFPYGLSASNDLALVFRHYRRYYCEPLLVALHIATVEGT